MSTFVQTVSGTIYEVEHMHVRRRRPAGVGYPLRGDEEWHELIEIPEIPKIGEPWVLKMKGLSPGVVSTIRTTSPVTRYVHVLMGGPEGPGSLPMDEFEGDFS